MSGKRGKYIRWNDERDKFIHEYTRNHTLKETCDEFYRRFGDRITPHNISDRKCKIKKGETRFGGMEKVQPGTERIDSHGYVVVAVENNYGKYRMKYIGKQILMWEKYHGMSLPEGYSVFFANRDKMDFSEENLVAVPNKIKVMLNNPEYFGLPEYYDVESLETCVNLAMLNSKINEAELFERECIDCGRTFKPTFKTNVRCRECIERRRAVHGRKKKSGNA